MSHGWSLFRWPLWMPFVAILAVACWLGYESRWVHQRRVFLAIQARRAFQTLPLSETRAPFPLWILGEHGLAEFPVVVYRKADMVPLFLPDAEYPEVQEAGRLFPEARVYAVVSVLNEEDAGRNAMPVPLPVRGKSRSRSTP